MFQAKTLGPNLKAMAALFEVELHPIGQKACVISKLLSKNHVTLFSEMSPRCGTGLARRQMRCAENWYANCEKRIDVARDDHALQALYYQNLNDA
jgi:hypothetical protein